jgi:hypothetical protein
MITSFEVGSVFKIVDQASPVLKNLSREVAALNKLVKELKVNLVGVSDLLRTTFEKINPSIASAVIETRELATEWQAVATAAANATRSLTAAAGAARRAGGGATAAGHPEDAAAAAIH